MAMDGGDLFSKAADSVAADVHNMAMDGGDLFSKAADSVAADVHNMVKDGGDLFSKAADSVAADVHNMAMDGGDLFSKAADSVAADVHNMVKDGGDLFSKAADSVAADVHNMAMDGGDLFSKAADSVAADVHNMVKDGGDLFSKAADSVAADVHNMAMDGGDLFSKAADSVAADVHNMVKDGGDLFSKAADSVAADVHNMAMDGGDLFSKAADSVAADVHNLTPDMLGIRKCLPSDSQVSSISEDEDISCSDVDYVPDSQSTSDDEQSDDEPAKVRRSVPSVATRTCASSSESTPQALTDESIVVMSVQKNTDGSRVYNKKHFCIFCSKPYSKIARHLEHKHKQEAEVAAALRFPKQSKSRRIQLDYLRKKGDRAHNLDVMREGSGTVVPCKQSSKADIKAQDFSHCAACQGLFKKRFLWKHMKTCTLAQRCSLLKPGRNRILSLCANAEPVPKTISAKLWRLINTMTQDDVTFAIKQDECIIRLGERLLNKSADDLSKHAEIRQKMREVGRLLLAGRELSTFQTMKDFIDPSNFRNVVEAVRRVAHYDEDSSSFKIPSLPLKLGHSLQKIAENVEGDAMISGKKKVAQKAHEFQRLYRTFWNEMISASALRTLEEAKWNKPLLIPFTEDVKKMHLHMEKKQKHAYQRLMSENSSKNWRELASVTLAQLILFNRRREGEVSKMRLSAFNVTDDPLHSDVAEALTALEKKLYSHFKRIEIRGKRGRKVPLLLTPKMQQSMELLTKTRLSCGVLEENVFFFARPRQETYLRGHACIHRFARECKANHPERIQSTKLRKHIATLLKILNLNESEMDQVTEFLGHNLTVHRKFYRLPEGTLQLAKLSKVFMAMERGSLMEFKGKNLDQIEIDPNETIPEENSDLSDTELLDSPPSAGKKCTSKRRVHRDYQSSGQDSVPKKGASKKANRVSKSDDQDSSPKKCSSKKRVHRVSDSNDQSSAPKKGASKKKVHRVSSKKKVHRVSKSDDQDSSPKKRTSKRRVHRDSDSSDQDAAPKRGTSKRRVHRDSDSSDQDAAPKRGTSKKRVHRVSESDDQSSTPKKARRQRTPWSTDEICAVEKTLMKFIKTGRTPGKADCISCINAAPEALKARDWMAVKFYVKNRCVSDNRTAKIF
ncbi:uncharacterized protein LOC134437210 isoform X2 [Engraulis encrasicolus]